MSLLKINRTLVILSCIVALSSCKEESATEPTITLPDITTTIAYTIEEIDLFPEGITYDSMTKQLFFVQINLMQL